jgi:CDP-2,3-bis-(O-geranylgeranyl)-sn-glycerol synthase
MVTLLTEVIKLVLFALPSYFANAVPVVLGGGKPIDFGANFFDKRRILGDGKTIRGFVAGVVAGTLAGGIEGYVLYQSEFAFYPTPMLFLISGFLLSLGTMFGDLGGSFIKRRMGMNRGQPSIILDQLFFFLFALLFVVPLAPSILSAEGVAFLFILTYVLHVFFNFAANRLGLKRVPW